MLHPNTRDLLLLWLNTTASLDFGRCLISELTTHSPRMVNNQHNAYTPDSTRCDRPYEMQSCHFMLCHATCTIRATCNIYKFWIIIFPIYNFHSSQFLCKYITQAHINMIFTYNIMLFIFPTITHKMAQISDSYKTGHLLVLSQPQTIFGSIQCQITMTSKHTTKPRGLSPRITTKSPHSSGLLGNSPKNFQYSAPKSWGQITWPVTTPKKTYAIKWI